MKDQVDFSFGDDSIARAYDTILVPSLFEPWTFQLIDDYKPWMSSKVLDLACGTGVVTKELARNIGSKGKVYALDINSQMLNIAKIKCNEWIDNIEFILGSSDSLEVSDNSIDTVVCQQGFQFFPNKRKSAKEIYRVLNPKGKAVLSTWCPVSECELFGVICKTLEAIGLFDISQMMRVPFDFLSKEELLASFNDIGFSKINLIEKEKELFLKDGLDSAIKFAYATPIGPKLNDLNMDKQEVFKELFLKNLQSIVQPDGSLGTMVTNILEAQK
jgi:ubiquinone/menaquinone biosynthesis C-methylase UbiE